MVCVPTFTKADRRTKANIGSGPLEPRMIKVCNVGIFWRWCEQAYRVRVPVGLTFILVIPLSVWFCLGSWEFDRIG